MKKFRKILTVLPAILLMYVLAAAPISAAVGTGQITAEKTEAGYDSDDTAKKPGWFQKGKYKYYRMPNGKLCTKKTAKIDGRYYSFDIKGRMQTGLITLADTNKGYFSKKNGYLLHCVKDLIVVKVYKSGIVEALDISGEMYRIHLTSKSSPKIELVDKNEKKISPSQIKKYSPIQVLYKGYILAMNPAMLENEFKVRLMREM